MRAVDTNVLVRLITRDDARQAVAADTFVASGAWVAHLVLAETTWVLSTVYDLAPAAIATAVDMLLNHSQLTVQEPEAVIAALVHYRRVPSLGFSDCLVLEIARRAGHLPVGAFDQRFAKLEDVQKL